MPKKSKRSQILTTSEQNERFDSLVNPTGEGEDPAVKALLSEDFLSMSNLDASSIALMLQEIIRGQRANSDEVARLRQKMDETDRTMISQFESNKRDVEDVLYRASKLKATGSKKDKIVAKGAKMFQDAVVNARANLASDKIKFEQDLAKMPQVLVLSPGVLITTMDGGSQVAKIIPEEIRIKHKVWFLPPGVPTMVPQAVADQLSNRRQSQEKTRSLQSVLSKQMESGKMAAEWNKINKEGVSMPQ